MDNENKNDRVFYPCYFLFKVPWYLDLILVVYELRKNLNFWVDWLFIWYVIQIWIIPILLIYCFAHARLFIGWVYMWGVVLVCFSI